MGFVGSHLSRKYVNEGHTVFGLDNLSNGNDNNVRDLIGKPNFKRIVGDIRDKKLVFSLVRDCDVVFHLAAIISNDQSLFAPYLTYETNVLGTLHVLEACKLYDKKMIYASTSECYGTAQYSPMNEKHPLDPSFVYAASKVGADRLCKAYADSYKMPVFIVRNFNLYGNAQRDNGYGSCIALFVKRALQGKPCIVFGSGLQSRDYLHVSDAVQAYDLVLECNDESLWGVPINFGSGIDHKIVDIANMVHKECGLNVPVVHVEGRPNDVKRLVADISFARKRLGFVPKVNFEDGLKEYVCWARDFKGEEWK